MCVREFSFFCLLYTLRCVSSHSLRRNWKIWDSRYPNRILGHHPWTSWSHSQSLPWRFISVENRLGQSHAGLTMNFVKSYVAPRKVPNTQNRHAQSQHAPPAMVELQKPTSAKVPAYATPPETSDSNRPFNMKSGRTSGVNTGTSTPRSRASQFPEGDFRNRPQEHINLIKSELALEWIAGKQQEKGWYSRGPDQGVVMRVSKGQYISAPASLKEDPQGLVAAAAMLNVRVSVEREIDRTPADFSVPHDRYHPSLPADFTL